MKNTILLLVLIFISICHLARAEDKVSQPTSTSSASLPSTQEKEYLDAVVLLIDPPTGMLGVSLENEITQAQEKYSFKVDPQNVDVTNPMNGFLEFTDISVGDHMDIYTAVNADGEEKVTEIYDYNAVEKD